MKNSRINVNDYYINKSYIRISIYNRMARRGTYSWYSYSLGGLVSGWSSNIRANKW
jgi:hypothetical protein